MKKLITVIALISATGLTLTSCSKKHDYTCACNINIGGQTQSAKTDQLKDLKKDDAQKKCDEIESTLNATAAQAGGSVDCTLSEN